jgi:hypothetical protein
MRTDSARGFFYYAARILIMPVPKKCPRCQEGMSSWVYIGKNDETDEPMYLCEACAESNPGRSGEELQQDKDGETAD